MVLLLFLLYFFFFFSSLNFNFKYLRSHIIMPCKFEVEFSKIDPLLDIPSIALINHHLPASQQHRWRLLFSTQIHGESFSAFIHQITNQGPVVIVVRDASGHVFGGFASMSWSIKSQFVGAYARHFKLITVPIWVPGAYIHVFVVTDEKPLPLEHW